MYYLFIICLMLTKKDLQAIKEMFDGRFNSIDNRFNSIDKRFDSVDKRLDTVDKRIDSVDKKLGALSAELKSARKELIELTLAGFSAHEPQIESHEIRITRLEKATFATS